MTRRQAEEALDVDVRDLQLDIRRKLAAQESSSPAFSEKRAKATVETSARERSRLESRPES
jgi:hypothetical protein